MSMINDRKIGKLYYGWTEEQTETNNWYDPWAQVWRPKPKDSKGVPTPAFSSSEVFAIQLIEHLDRVFSISTEVVRSGRVWFAIMNVYRRTNISSVSEDFFFATAVASCAINLNRQKEFLIENLQQLNTIVSV